MSAITITNAGLDLLRDGMSGVNASKITYVALGTSNTAPTTGDIKLGTEVFRKQVTSYTNGASHGEILINGYIAPSDAVGVVIAEVGYFGGNASSAKDSGVLLARGLYSHTKVNTESIQLQVDLTL